MHCWVDEGSSCPCLSGLEARGHLQGGLTGMLTCKWRKKRSEIFQENHSCFTFRSYLRSLPATLFVLTDLSCSIKKAPTPPFGQNECSTSLSVLSNNTVYLITLLHVIESLWLFFSTDVRLYELYFSGCFSRMWVDCHKFYCRTNTCLAKIVTHLDIQLVSLLWCHNLLRIGLFLC